MMTVTSSQEPQCARFCKKLSSTEQSTVLGLTALGGKGGWAHTRVTIPRLAPGDSSGRFSGTLSHNTSVRKQLSVAPQHVMGSEKHSLAVRSCRKHPTIAG